MNVTLQVDTASFSRVTAKLHQKKNFAISAGKSAVHDTAEAIFSAAQMNIPRKTGALAASGKIAYQDSTQTSSAIISYGDSTVNPNTGRPTSSYAVVKHEDPRNGKWLENAVLECTDLYRSNLRDKIGRALSE